MKNAFDKLEEIIAALALSAMTILAFVNVIARYVFSASLSFTDEITTNLFVLLTLIGASIATERNAHLGLGIITDNVSPKLRRSLAVLANLLGAGFTAVLVYYGVIMAYNEYKLQQVTSGMQLPEWIFGSFVPIGAALLLVRFLQKAIKISKEEVK